MERMKIIRVSKIEIPEISDYYTVFICANYSFSPTIRNIRDYSLIFFSSNFHWHCATVGRIPTVVQDALKDYAVYETEDGGIIVPVNSVKLFISNKFEGFMKRALSLSEGMQNPAVVFRRDLSEVVGCVMDISEPKFLLFEAIPKCKKNKNVDHEVVTIEGFWEIVSYVITSEKDEAFIFKLKFNWRW